MVTADCVDCGKMKKNRNLYTISNDTNKVSTIGRQRELQWLWLSDKGVFKIDKSI